MTETASPLKYHDIEELQTLPIEDLAALVDQIPTERARAYKSQYDRWLRQQGVMTTVGSDGLEQTILLDLFEQYQATGLVPAGEAAWVRVPPTTQERARLNEGFIQSDIAPAPRRINPVFIVAGLAVLGSCLLLMMFSRSGKGDPSTALRGTATRTLTPTPAHSPTPTPLALENQDKVIQGGSGGGSDKIAYPVTLKVALSSGGQPRVFVVQRRTIQTSQWDFDSNPDIASFVNGMTVRPVIGIPWSSENAALFNSLQPRAFFTLQMNTGASLRYQFASTSQISRSDTSILRQVGPALVLILIGERDEDGQLTATRPMVLASYQPDGELVQDGLLVNSLVGTPIPVTPTLIPTPVDRVDMEVVSVTSQSAAKAVTITLRVFNARQSSIRIRPNSLWIAFGYDPNPIGPRVPAEGLAPFDLLSGQAVNLSVSFPWSGEPFATLGTDGLGVGGTYQFAVQFSAGVQG